MQLAGTRAGARRAGRAAVSDLDKLRLRHPDRREEPAAQARAPGAADECCNAPHRCAAPAPGGRVPRSASSPGTRHGPCRRTALRRRSPWVPGPVSAPPRRLPSGRGRRRRGRTSRRDRAIRSGRGGWPVRCRNSTYSRLSHTVSTVKQVAGQDPGGLLAQERPPRRARSPWRRVQTVAAQGCADRGRRDLRAKPEQPTLDALVAPAGTLRGQAEDQLLDLRVQRGTSGSTMGIGPCTGDQTAVPAQQGAGLGVAGAAVAAFQLGLLGRVQGHAQRRWHDRPPCMQER
jgi:hypothetical protein